MTALPTTIYGPAESWPVGVANGDCAPTALNSILIGEPCVYPLTIGQPIDITTGRTWTTKPELPVQSVPDVLLTQAKARIAQIEKTLADVPALTTELERLRRIVDAGQ